MDKQCRWRLCKYATNIDVKAHRSSGSGGIKVLDENATPAGAAVCLLRDTGGPNGPRLQMDQKDGR